MESAVTTRRRLPVSLLIAAGLAALVLLTAGLYLKRPVPQPDRQVPATAEVKAYVSNLQLSDVTMQATDNLMGQSVIEVQGKIANSGSRSLASVDVYCLFLDINGREVARQRLPIVPAKRTPLKPGETRTFRLPFDTIPDGWNQALPRMVIARIAFAS